MFFHHLSDAASYFENIKANLNPYGKIALIEWLPKERNLDKIHAGHCAPETKIIETMESAGFLHSESFDSLENQSFNVFLAV